MFLGPSTFHAGRTVHTFAPVRQGWSLPVTCAACVLYALAKVTVTVMCDLCAIFSAWGFRGFLAEYACSLCLPCQVW